MPRIQAIIPMAPSMHPASWDFSAVDLPPHQALLPGAVTFEEVQYATTLT